MATIGVELKQGNAYKQLFAIVSHATKVHHESEGCTFKRTDEEIADEVFEFLVAKVEDAEDNCPLHQNGSSANAGFTDCPNTVAGFSVIGLDNAG